MARVMTFIDICAGVGGISLGLERAGMICKGQVEIDDNCRKVLERHWPGVPRWTDATAIEPGELPTVDLISGGYPCQPFSCAGLQRAEKDDRHIWPYIFEIVKHKKPSWCLFENVANHIRLGGDTVLSDLESIGYACQPLIIPACAVGAQHRRDRLWILAHADGQRQLFKVKAFGQKHNQGSFKWASGTFDIRADSDEHKPEKGSAGNIRKPDGLPYWLDRVKMMGNAVHPGVVEVIGKAIITAHNEAPTLALEGEI